MLRTTSPIFYDHPVRTVLGEVLELSHLNYGKFLKGVVALRASPVVGPPGRIKMTPWGEPVIQSALGRFCAQSSPPARPQAPKLAHFAAQFRRIKGPYGRELAHIRHGFAVSRRSIINTIISYHIFHHRKIKYFNKILQQQIVQYKLYSSPNKNSYFITRRARCRP